MNYKKIRVFPSIGRGSYIVQLEIPKWVKNLEDYINNWIEDDLINVDHWEFD